MVKRQSIKSKNIKMDKKLDSLFRPDTEVEEEIKENKKESKEIKLRGIDHIKDYYHNLDGGNQYTVYIPKELQDAIKIKCLKRGETVSSFYKNALVDNILSEDEIKDAYNDAYEQRNK